MKNRLILTASLLCASLLAFGGANAKTLRLAYDADPVTLDIHEQLLMPQQYVLIYARVSSSILVTR